MSAGRLNAPLADASETNVVSGIGSCLRRCRRSPETMAPWLFIARWSDECGFVESSGARTQPGAELPRLTSGGERGGGGRGPVLTPERGVRTDWSVGRSKLRTSWPRL